MLQIDGIIYSLQKGGGVTVYFNELFKYLENHLEFKLSLENPLVNDSHLGSANTSILKSRTFERYRNCRILSKDIKILHSSYYRVNENSAVSNITTVHDFIYEKYTTGLKRSIHHIQKMHSLRNSSDIICVSYNTYEDLLYYYKPLPQQKIHVIHNGVSNSFYQLNNLKKYLNRPYFLYVGNRKGYKNFQIILDLLETESEFELICVGGGAFTADEFYKRDILLQSRIRHFNNITDEDLNILYNKAYCLFYPSLYEGFGIPVLEAMQAGCPVVSFKCPSVLEIGADALTVFELNDVESLKFEFSKLFDTQYRNSVIEKGLKNAKKYNWELTHEKTLSVYRSAICIN